MKFNYKFVFKDRAKEQSRELRKTDRELGRDRHKLEAEEQKLINEIRKNAASGNKKVKEKEKEKESNELNVDFHR